MFVKLITLFILLSFNSFCLISKNQISEKLNLQINFLEIQNEIEIDQNIDLYLIHKLSKHYIHNDFNIFYTIEKFIVTSKSVHSSLIIDLPPPSNFKLC